jgi:predicted dehydrogenase
MLSDSRVIAVDLCVPNDLHRVYAERAAAAGKHVICEKPVAMTSVDGLAMLEACGRAKVQLLVAHVLRFWPEYEMIRQMLQANRFGMCRAITMRRMLSLLLNVTGKDGWRTKPERMGGAVLDLQIHDIDFLYWTFGMPETVYCAAARSRDGGLNHVYTSLTFPGGTRAHIEASYMLKGDPIIFTTKAICDEASLDYVLNLDRFEMHDLQQEAGRTDTSVPASLTCYRPGSPPETLLHSDPDILHKVFRRELTYFADCVLGRTSNEVVGPSDAVTAVRIAEACIESERTGTVVRTR